MELSIWTYEGPPHVGAMRIANSMSDVHYVLHAPQGDTYADLLFTMIERNAHRPPVTYTTFQARDLGGDTAGMVTKTVRETYERFRPNALLVGESCTAELIQDQPGALAKGLNLPVPVVPLELPSYSKKENWGASETFYHLVRGVLADAAARGREGANTTDGGAAAMGESEANEPGASAATRRPCANLLGPTSLGFRCRDDVVEITRLLDRIGVDVNVVAPLGASCADLVRIPDADFNICLYPEIGRTLGKWLTKSFGQPLVETVPIGVEATRAFVREIAALAGVETDVEAFLAAECGRLPWYSRSIDSTYLTHKRVFVYGDGTHVLAAARIARDELGFRVVGMGTFSREMAREVRALAAEFGVEAIIGDDHLAVEKALEELQPELVLGTQMERHVAKRLGIPCAVISSPVHVQDFPARYSPQMGFEGANVIFDTWVHPLMMGLEEHLLHMFREDFEFNDAAGASHRHESAAPTGRVMPSEVVDALASAGERTAEAADHAAPANAAAAAASGVAETGEAASGATAAAPVTDDGVAGNDGLWTPEAERELGKIPFFVRGKARRNTETFAREFGHATITLETLYDAKAHYAR